ncbi:hypothetical protein SESBI_34980 [Sesbania bispinosa]|nr:hypothetical protein SESBI_34980 [Sesbania bispinosa]
MSLSAVSLTARSSPPPPSSSTHSPTSHAPPNAASAPTTSSSASALLTALSTLPSPLTLAFALSMSTLHAQEEIADTVMALFLGLLRRTHLLSRHALSASGWLGSVQPLCRGMRRCRGLVLGIVGRSASARALATRSLAFKMSVLYFDVHSGKGKLNFPSAARRMDTLNDLLAASDLISLHCALTNDTMQIINAECLQHVKPGGCALDGAEGPQWMEAWVKEMPNVLILPRSADYSEEVWMEIREKAISILQTFFIDGIIPKNALSDMEEESEVDDENEQSDQQFKENALQIIVREQMDDVHVSPESSRKKEGSQVKESSSQHQVSSLTQSTSARSEGRRSRSGKKAKKRHTRQKSQQKSEDPSALEKEGTSQRDDTAMSGTDQALSSSSEDSRSRKTPALYARDRSALHVSRQRVKGGGWILDSMSNVSKRDPAAQFPHHLQKQGQFHRNFALIGGAYFHHISKSNLEWYKDTIGLRSLAAGGKLLQVVALLKWSEFLNLIIDFR